MEENAVSTEMRENKQASISNSIKNGKIFIKQFFVLWFIS